MARAAAERAVGNLEMAAELADVVLQRDPGNVEARDMFIGIALDTRDRERLQKARRLVETAIAKIPTNDQLQLTRARILHNLQDDRTAIASLEAYCMTEKGRLSVPALLGLAELYRIRGDMTASDEKLQQAEKLAPDSSEVLIARLAWLGAQGDVAKIMKLVSARRAKKPTDVRVIVAAAWILTSLGSEQSLKKALELYDYALRSAPHSRAARLGVASVAYRMGDVDRAERIYRKVLRENPNDLQSLNDLALILAHHHHDYQAALQLANRGLKLAPNNRYLLDTRGGILMKLLGKEN